MRIAISAYGPDLNARIANRLGTSPYIVVIDPATMAFEAISNPGAFGGRGSGIHANVLVISKQVDVVITGYCSPMVEKYLTDNGILLVTGITGTVQDAVEKYKTEELWKYQRIEAKPGMKEIPRDRTAVAHALRHSMRQFAGLLPALVSVVFGLGVFNSFV